MNALRDKKLRFSDVAYAAGTTPKSLRNWLQRKQVRLATFEDSTGWREFNLTDVAILALIRQMVDFGVNVEEASDIANSVVIGYGVSLDPSASRFADALNFSADYLILWRENGEWKQRMFTPSKRQIALPEAHVSIALRPIVGDAMERALLGSQMDDWSNEDESVKAALQKLLITIQDATPSKGEGTH